MPMLDAYIPEGALSADAERKLLKQLGIRPPLDVQTPTSSTPTMSANAFAPPTESMPTSSTPLSTSNASPAPVRWCRQFSSERLPAK